MNKGRMRRFRKLVSICILSLCFCFQHGCSREEQAEEIPPVPTRGMVTMVDLGAHECLPCKLMEPIIKELKEEYHGRVSIVFIDVWKHKNEPQKYGIRAIPTQIFYDRDGKEVYRHEGFMDKKSIVNLFRKLGVE